MKKLILHIPHASIHIPDQTGFLVSNEDLQEEILKLTDWYTDDLFSNAKDHIIRAPFSRVFCDVERFADDAHEVMARKGMGVLYETSDLGETIRKVSPVFRQKVLKEYYYPHHNMLKEAVQQQLIREGKTLIIDCHSFPDQPFKRDLNKQPNRPDFNIGTDDFHTPQKLVDTAAEFFNSKGYSVGINWPYTGTIVPLDYHKTNKKVKSIMLEINRKLYLRDSGNQKSDGYAEIRMITQEFLELLKSSFFLNL